MRKPLLNLHRVFDVGHTGFAGDSQIRADVALRGRLVQAFQQLVRDFTASTVALAPPLRNGVQGRTNSAVASLAAVAGEVVAVPAVDRTVVQGFRHTVDIQRAVVSNTGTAGLTVTPTSNRALRRDGHHRVLHVGINQREDRARTTVANHNIFHRHRHVLLDIFLAELQRGHGIDHVDVEAGTRGVESADGGLEQESVLHVGSAIEVNQRLVAQVGPERNRFEEVVCDLIFPDLLNCY